MHELFSLLWVIFITSMVIFVNIWVWFFPNSYIDYYRKIYRSNLGWSPFREWHLKLIESPGFTVMSRIIFGGGLFALLVVLYDVYMK